MSMAVIVINVTINGALINCVHLCTIKSLDNAPYFFKGPHKVLLEMRHGNITAIINTNKNSIGVKIILVSMATGVGFTRHTNYV